MQNLCSVAKLVRVEIVEVVFSTVVSVAFFNHKIPWVGASTFTFVCCRCLIFCIPSHFLCANVAETVESFVVV